VKREKKEGEGREGGETGTSRSISIADSRKMRKAVRRFVPRPREKRKGGGEGGGGEEAEDEQLLSKFFPPTNSDLDNPFKKKREGGKETPSPPRNWKRSRHRQHQAMDLLTYQCPTRFTHFCEKKKREKEGREKGTKKTKKRRGFHRSRSGFFVPE